MTNDPAAPIACLLTGDDYKERLAWIAEINRRYLIDRRRFRHSIAFTYRGSARADVREMIRREQQCCGFLAFETRDDTDAITVTVRAPEGAEHVLDSVFEPSDART